MRWSPPGTSLSGLNRWLCCPFAPSNSFVSTVFLRSQQHSLTKWTTLSAGLHTSPSISPFAMPKGMNLEMRSGCRSWKGVETHGKHLSDPTCPTNYLAIWQDRICKSQQTLFWSLHGRKKWLMLWRASVSDGMISPSSVETSIGKECRLARIQNSCSDFRVKASSEAAQYAF